MHEVEPTPPAKPVELSKLELAPRMDLYQTHYDLFIKGVCHSLAIVGTATGFIFQPATAPETRIALAIMILACSSLAVAAGWVCLLWVHEAQDDLDRICAEPAILRIAVTAPKRIVTLVLALLVSLPLTGIAGLWWWLSRGEASPFRPGLEWAQP